MVCLRRLSPPASSDHGRQYSCYRIMNRSNENTPTFFTRIANGLSRKLRLAVVPPSKSSGPPAPQTSPSTNSRVNFLDRTLNVKPSRSVLQFSIFRMNSSYPFSLASPQTRSSMSTMHGSVFNTLWRSAILVNDGCGSYYC